ncbi:MAG TPA: RluA family pseudouridine synthase [Candidatus Tumulicola sp.]
MRKAVSVDEAGIRADVVVARLTGASRAAVAAAIKRGDVLVDGGAIKASRQLEEGETLDYDVPAPERPVALPEDIDVPIVYEDEDLLVVDKPFGMVTHPAHGSPRGTLVNALLGYLGTPLPGSSIRPGLVHRLDRDTSGLLVVAKNEEALSALGIAMKNRRIGREYVGLVAGVPDHARGTIEGPIGRDPDHRLKFAIVASGKPAVTHYEVLESFARNAELSFRLETGRTHQIRVHLAKFGHPLVNDRIYGRADPRSELPGQALHARRLSFEHPRTKEPMVFEADPSPEYVRTREALAKDR